MIEVISNTFERHVQTVIAVLLGALLIWVGTTTNATSIAVAEMKIEIIYLKNAVEDLKDH